MSKKPVVLMVLDGYGLNDRTEGNAIALANTPVMDKLMKECPFVKGQASRISMCKRKCQRTCSRTSGRTDG